MLDLARGVLEEFASAAMLGTNGELRPLTAAGGIEALRRAYRDRNLTRGLCMFCPRPRTHARDRLLRTCEPHRRYYAAKALRRYRAQRETACAASNV